jgi:hypothetical protein
VDAAAVGAGSIFLRGHRRRCWGGVVAVEAGAGPEHDAVGRAFWLGRVRACPRGRAEAWERLGGLSSPNRVPAEIGRSSRSAG